MYDSYELGQLSQFSRLHAGKIAVPTGRICGFVPAELAHFKSDPVGQILRSRAKPIASPIGLLSVDRRSFSRSETSSREREPTLLKRGSPTCIQIGEVI